MLVHIWSVLCLKSVIDQETNNITLVDCIEQLSIKTSPAISASSKVGLPINYEIVSLFTRADDNQPCRGEARVTIVDPTGTAIDEPAVFAVDLTGHERMRLRNRIAGLPLRGSGRYKFVCQYRNEGETNWTDAIKLPLQVVIETAEGSPQH